MPSITVITFDTVQKRAKGLQHMFPIPPATLFVFPDMRAGMQFHSQNVREPFDIAFLSARGEVLDVVTVVPPRAIRTAPPGTFVVVEAAEGELLRLGFEQGRIKNLHKILPPATVDEVQE